MALDPITGSIIANIGGNILGGIFGRRRRHRPSPPSVDQRLVEAQLEQMRLASDMQRKLMAQEEENRRYFQENLPFVRNVLSGILGQLGFTSSGQALPVFASPMLGLQMSLGEAQAGRTVAGMAQRGIPAEVAERVRQAITERTQQRALADAYAQRMQSLPLAAELAKQMQLAGVYSPTAMQAMPNPLQAFSALSQTTLAQQQMRQQWEMAEAERQRQLSSQIGQLAGMFFYNRLGGGK